MFVMTGNEPTQFKEEDVSICSSVANTQVLTSRSSAT